jgi:hypothetical protein
MLSNKNVYYNEDRDKIEKANAKEFLNSIAQSHSIKDEILKKHSNMESVQNINKKNDSNADEEYKVLNFL